MKLKPIWNVAILTLILSTVHSTNAFANRDDLMRHIGNRWQPISIHESEIHQSKEEKPLDTEEQLKKKELLYQNKATELLKDALVGTYIYRPSGYGEQFIGLSSRTKLGVGHRSYRLFNDRDGDLLVAWNYQTKKPHESNQILWIPKCEELETKMQSSGKDEASSSSCQQPGPSGAPLKQISDLQNHILKNIASNPNFSKAYEFLKERNWNASADEILKIFNLIDSHHKSWQLTAAQQNKTFIPKIAGMEEVPAAIYVQPSGKFLIAYKPLFVAKSIEKTVEVIFSISGGIAGKDRLEGMQEYVILLPNSNNKRTSEETAYRRMHAYKTHNKIVLDGLVEAEIVHLEGHKIAFLQKRYNSDLQKSGALENPNSPGFIPRLRQIATGLSHLHNMKLVHGDLKPENILYNPETNEVRIADFGLTYQPENRIEPRTTAGYEAPEMVNYSARSVKENQVEYVQKRDIYSFGIMTMSAIPGVLTLWERCGGVFKDYKAWGDYGKCIKEQAPHLYEAAKGKADTLCKDQPQPCLPQVVASCLTPDPNARPIASTLESLLSEIQNRH